MLERQSVAAPEVVESSEQIGRRMIDRQQIDLRGEWCGEKENEEERGGDRGNRASTSNVGLRRSLDRAV
jgi:hypothetical protein